MGYDNDRRALLSAIFGLHIQYLYSQFVEIALSVMLTLTLMICVHVHVGIVCIIIRICMCVWEGEAIILTATISGVNHVTF